MRKVARGKEGTMKGLLFVAAGALTTLLALVMFDNEVVCISVLLVCGLVSIAMMRK